MTNFNNERFHWQSNERTDEKDISIFEKKCQIGVNDSCTFLFEKIHWQSNAFLFEIQPKDNLSAKIKDFILHFFDQFRTFNS